MIRTSLAALAFTLIATLPAYAVRCDDTGSGLKFSFELNLGEPMSEQERNEFDLMILRRHGVDATRVERWGGCLRAYVRKPTGGEEMQFFDPSSYERVQ